MCDLEEIIDSARGPLLSKAQALLAVLRNLDAFRAPRDIRPIDLFRLFQQCMVRTATGESNSWSARLYDNDRWGIMFIGGMWFQDLFNYELPNLETSTAVVADAGLDPTRFAGAEVAFSFKNAGGWRHIVEAARCAPSLPKWHKEHGRHPIFANRQFVPIEQLARAGCTKERAPSSSASTVQASQEAEITSR